MSEDRNPFENVPDDFVTGLDDIDMIQDTDANTTLDELENLPEIHYDLEDKGRLAMVAGVGFVFLAVLIYLGIVTKGNISDYLFGFFGILLSALVAFFYMLDDLRIRPVGITERGTRFIAGILLALLFLLIFLIINSYWPDYASILYLVAIIVLTNGSIGLFLYCMLWEE